MALVLTRGVFRQDESLRASVLHSGRWRHVQPVVQSLLLDISKPALATKALPRNNWIRVRRVLSYGIRLLKAAPFMTLMAFYSDPTQGINSGRASKVAEIWMFSLERSTKAQDTGKQGQVDLTS